MIHLVLPRTKAIIIVVLVDLLAHNMSQALCGPEQLCDLGPCRDIIKPLSRWYFSGHNGLHQENNCLETQELSKVV